MSKLSYDHCCVLSRFNSIIRDFMKKYLKLTITKTTINCITSTRCEKMCTNLYLQLAFVKYFRIRFWHVELYYYQK